MRLKRSASRASGIRCSVLGKLPARWNQPAGAVHVARRLHEQLQQRRMRALARQQRGGGRDQPHVRGGRSRARSTTPRGSMTGVRNGKRRE